jgi:hypothetical protein
MDESRAVERVQFRRGRRRPGLQRNRLDQVDCRWVVVFEDPLHDTEHVGEAFGVALVEEANEVSHEPGHPDVLTVGVVDGSAFGRTLVAWACRGERAKAGFLGILFVRGTLAKV